MELREIRQLAEAFVSGQLPVETANRLSAHLNRCPRCRAEIAQLRRLRRATREAFEREPGLAARPGFVSALKVWLQVDPPLKGL